MNAPMAKYLPIAASEPRPTLGVISSGRATALYAAGLLAALVPFVLLSHDVFWVNILTYTYLFAGLAVADVPTGFVRDWLAFHDRHAERQQILWRASVIVLASVAAGASLVAALR